MSYTQVPEKETRLRGPKGGTHCCFLISESKTVSSISIHNGISLIWIHHFIIQATSEFGTIQTGAEFKFIFVTHFIIMF